MPPVLAVSHGTNAVPVQGGVSVGQPAGSHLVPGSCADPSTQCGRPTKKGGVCTAPPAHGLDACVGHLRSEGRLPS